MGILARPTKTLRSDKNVQLRREGELPGSGSETTSREAGITENKLLTTRRKPKKKR